jgi:hypothetical protein
MEIYIRNYSVWNGENYTPTSHRNFLDYNKCKQSIEEYIDDMKACHQDLKVEYGEEQKYNSCCIFTVTISWKGYYSTTCRENFTISKEPVY